MADRPVLPLSGPPRGYAEWEPGPFAFGRADAWADGEPIGGAASSSDDGYQETDGMWNVMEQGKDRKRERNREFMRKKREDPAYRQEARERERDGARERMREKRKDPDYRAWEQAQREDPDYRKRRRDAARDSARAVRSLPAALQVYADYRSNVGRGWPEVPPAGLQVAVDPATAGLQVRTGPPPAAVVVSLNEPQPQAGPSRVPVPRFLADPTLDLEDPRVQALMGNKGADRGAYKEMQDWQDWLLSALRQESFGVDAAGSPQVLDDWVTAQGPMRETEQPEYFRGLDVDKLARQYRDYRDYWTHETAYCDPFLENPIGSSAFDHLPGGGGEGNAPPSELDNAWLSGCSSEQQKYGSRRK